MEVSTFVSRIRISTTPNFPSGRSASVRASLRSRERSRNGNRPLIIRGEKRLREQRNSKLPKNHATPARIHKMTFLLWSDIARSVARIQHIFVTKDFLPSHHAVFKSDALTLVTFGANQRKPRIFVTSRRWCCNTLYHRLVKWVRAWLYRVT